VLGCVAVVIIIIIKLFINLQQEALGRSQHTFASLSLGKFVRGPLRPSPHPTLFQMALMRLLLKLSRLPSYAKFVVSQALILEVRP
jgi:hypothetical protein